MSQSRHAAFGLLLGLSVFSSALSADSYRCGRKLVRSGDSSADVLRVCGEPAYKDRAQETIRLDGEKQRAPVERWFYRQGGRSLRHIVIIHRGKVVAIEVAGR